jgi:hypothetical protein
VKLSASHHLELCGVSSEHVRYLLTEGAGGGNGKHVPGCAVLLPLCSSQARPVARQETKLDHSQASH